MSGWEYPCYTKIILYSPELQGCSLSLSCTLQPHFPLEVQSQFSLQIWFLWPWHQSVCTYRRSHALTSLKGIFLCIMLCSVVQVPVYLWWRSCLFFFNYVYNKKVPRKVFAHVVHLNVWSVYLNMLTKHEKNVKKFDCGSTGVM